MRHALLVVIGEGQGEVTCTKPAAGWPSEGFTVSITGVDPTGCASNITKSTMVRLFTAPTVEIQGAAAASICASAPSMTVNYTVISSWGGNRSVQVHTNTTEVTCALKTSSGGC